MVKEIIVNTEHEMIELGALVGAMLEENMVLALSGDLGAGKTTFTKGIGQALNIKTVINSPTFTILKVHQGRLPLYHMDVYRINRNTGDEDLEEYFESGGVCVVEWAENISYLLPEEYMQIDIEIIDAGRRRLRFQSESPRYSRIIESVNV